MCIIGREGWQSSAASRCLPCVSDARGGKSGRGRRRGHGEEGGRLSWRERISSRKRFEDYRRRRREKAADGGDEAASPTKHRSLGRLYRELSRLLRGQKLSI